MGERLKDRVAVVTGGGSGIGRAIAREFNSEGAKVVIADIKHEPNEGGDPTDKIINDTGGNALFVETDVADESSVVNMIEMAMTRFGRLDIIVNSAGIPMKKSLADTTAEDFDQMYGVTVKGPFLTAKHAIPHILKNGKGRIINVASNFSFTALPEMTAYTSSKAAVIGLTKSLAIEFGPQGLNVNAICPGATKTEMSRPFWGTSEGVELLKARNPLRKDGKFVALPEDVAKLALFLASDDSEMITGESILIDSGWNVQ